MFNLSTYDCRESSAFSLKRPWKKKGVESKRTGWGVTILEVKLTKIRCNIVKVDQFDMHLTLLSKNPRNSRGPLNDADGWMMALAIPAEKGVLREKEVPIGVEVHVIVLFSGLGCTWF